MNAKMVEQALELSRHIDTLILLNANLENLAIEVGDEADADFLILTEVDTLGMHLGLLAEGASELSKMIAGEAR
jgi:hypothetical protein